LPNSSEETFLLPDGFLIALDPQVRLLALPNFGVNKNVRKIFGKPQWEKSKVQLVYQVKLLKTQWEK
jgi:hypothetical protein